MRWWLLIGVFSLVFIASASFAVMLPMTTEDLTKASDAVVRGRVVSVESYWSDDGKTILSKAIISVDEVVRGDAVPWEIAVEYEGGEVDGLGLKVSDSVVFEVGEETLVFLKPKVPGQRAGSLQSPSRSEGAGPSAIFQVVGKAQGKYSIDAAGMASKKGFSVVGKPGAIDNNIHVEELIRKIKEVKK